MITANMHEAKSRLSELVAAAVDGEEVILCSNGEPRVQLVPVPVAPVLRNLTPDPQLVPIFAPDFDPAEPLTGDEWPEECK